MPAGLGEQPARTRLVISVAAGSGGSVEVLFSDGQAYQATAGWPSHGPAGSASAGADQALR